MHTIRIAEANDRDLLAALHLLLWPECSFEEEKLAIDALISTGMSGTLPAAVFVAEAEDGRIIGFLEVGLRSHADGCDPAQPVGFVEGWFVLEASRNQGVGRALMRAAENWARQRGAIEMASDSWITQEDSHRAHEALGFNVVDRCVLFRKSL
jgi:aminoglycoside 6'-N-acetyltransferase I